MNQLILGTGDKTQHFLDAARSGFLLIDDGEIGHAVHKRFPKARVFDPHHHSFNPLRGMTDKLAAELTDVLYSAFPEGVNTLTVRNGKRALKRLLRAHRGRLDELKADRADPAEAEALAIVDDILFFDILRQVLCAHTNQFSFRGSVIAILNRAQLGDFTAFIIGNLLIGQAKGQIMLPDYAFYGRPHHSYLLRQNRLTAGLNYLSETPLSKGLLSVNDKRTCGVLYDDARVLANHAGLKDGDVSFSEYLADIMA